MNSNHSTGATKVLALPGTNQDLELKGSSLVGPQGQSFAIQSGVYLMAEAMDVRFQDFETKYTSEAEPWDYSKRAVELIRHEYVQNKVRELAQKPSRVLDIGCALGQLTMTLDGIVDEVWGVDLSPTAVVKANQLMKPSKGTKFFWASADAVNLPFKSDQFQIVLLSDGLIGWELNEDLQLKVLKEVHRVLAPGGYAILTDYLKPRDFDSHIKVVQKGQLKLIQTDHLGDRLGFQLANNLKPLSHLWPFEQIIGSLSLNRLLSQVGQNLGKAFSKHLAMVLQKK